MNKRRRFKAKARRRNRVLTHRLTMIGRWNRALARVIRRGQPTDLHTIGMTLLRQRGQI